MSIFLMEDICTLLLISMEVLLFMVVQLLRSQIIGSLYFVVSKFRNSSDIFITEEEVLVFISCAQEMICGNIR